MNAHAEGIAKMAAVLAENPAIEKEVEEEIALNYVVSRLLSMRVAKGITQEQIAEEMGCDPSKISRLEGGNDTNLRWMDIVGYIQALNLEMSIIFHDPAMPAAERIKDYVFKIIDDLESLSALVKEGDAADSLAQKIHQFYGEVLINFLVRYKDSYDKLNSVIKVPPRITAATVCNPPVRKESTGDESAGCHGQPAQV